MKFRYRVRGTTTVDVFIEVVADSPDEALIQAQDDLCGLSTYVGNGGMDKLIGVDGENESVEAGGEIEWDDADELGPADEEDE